MCDIIDTVNGDIMNLYDFIKKYKDVSYLEKDLSEVDMLIYSELSYLPLDNLDFNNKEYTIKEISKLIDRKKTSKYFYAQNKAMEVLDAICDTKRFSDVIVFDYEYEVNDNMQFCAETFLLPNKQIVVSFEGTDDTIAGWKEDAILSYKYPTESQIKAGDYLNNLLKKIKENIYICGHSKGGNLALVGSLRTNLFKKNRISKIYSFDGPGLKESEFNSLNYKLIRKKLINIIPDESLVGVLFEQENVEVVKSSEVGIMQHDATSWQVEDDRFLRTTQSDVSKDLNKTLEDWLKKYDYKERELIVDKTFCIFEEIGIKKLNDIIQKRRQIFNQIVKSSKDLDDETRLLIFNCWRVLIGSVGSILINEEIKKIKQRIKNII